MWDVEWSHLMNKVRFITIIFCSSQWRAVEKQHRWIMFRKETSDKAYLIVPIMNWCQCRICTSRTPLLCICFLMNSHLSPPPKKKTHGLTPLTIITYIVWCHWKFNNPIKYYFRGGVVPVSPFGSVLLSSIAKSRSGVIGRIFASTYIKIPQSHLKNDKEVIRGNHAPGRLIIKKNVQNL